MNFFNNDILGLSVEEKEQLSNLVQKAFENAPSYRTDTEIRILVLDGNKYPTPASRYYKSLFEVDNLYKTFAEDYFAYMFKEEELALVKGDINENEIRFALENLKRAMQGKIKELRLWSVVVSELEESLVEQGMPLDDPDVHQKVFFLVRHIRKCIEVLSLQPDGAKPLSEVGKNELFSKLVTNAEVVKRANLTPLVLNELSLSEKHFVSSQNILPVNFTEEEAKLIEEAQKIGTMKPSVNKV